jgi:hypothetical protein
MTIGDALQEGYTWIECYFNDDPPGVCGWYSQGRRAMRHRSWSLTAGLSEPRGASQARRLERRSMLQSLSGGG